MKIVRGTKKLSGSAVVFFGIFSLMLLSNILTPYLADDYSYLFSFSTGEPINSLVDIVPSMIAHTKSMNGRIAAHSLVQVFVLMPQWVFDIVNSLAFCLLIKLLCNITRQNKDNWLTQIGVFCAVWLFCPAFGEVNLWQDGAINYLWSGVAGVLFLIPFVECFLGNRTPKDRGLLFRIGFLFFSFVTGAYSETVSAAVIFMAMMLVGMDAWMNHRRVCGYLAGAVAVAVFGYVSIYLAPAQWVNKGAEISLTGLINSFIKITMMYESYLPLLILSAVLFAANIMKKSDTKMMVLAAVLFLGALAANYIMVFAAYYSPRSAVGAVLFHIAANVALMEAISWDKEYQVKNACVIAVLILMTIPQLLVGVRCIGVTWKHAHANERLIQESKENGIMHVEVPVITPENQYSAMCGLKYLDTENPYTWPNGAMAKYYGVETIIGVPEQGMD